MDAAQIARLKYVLSHGVKENLVERLRDWPGVHAVRALLARKREGVGVAGAEAVLAHHPHDCPEKLKKGPAPLFHTATAEMRQFL